MATRTELLCYQLGLRLFQARELHTPHCLDQGPAIVRLSIVRLEQSVGLLWRIPELAPAVPSAWGTIASWISTPRYYSRLRCAESWQHDDLMQQHRDELAVMQQAVRMALEQYSRELEDWLALGEKILSDGESDEIHPLLDCLGLSRDTILPGEPVSKDELDNELRESYFHGLEEERVWRHQYPLWDIAELGLQRLWENVEEEPEPLQLESLAVANPEQREVDALPHGPGRRGAFHYKGRTVTGIEKKPWLLLKLAWESRPEPVDLAVAGEEVWGNDIIDTGRVRTAASKANRALMEADIPITIHIQDEQILLDIGN